MKNTFLLLVFISIILTNNKVSAQCTEAQKYVSQIQQADSWSPTKRVNSGDKIQAWTQFAAWNAYKCQCDSPENLSDSEIPQLVNAMNATRGIISKEYSSYGIVPKIYKVSDCPKGSSNSSNSASSKTSTQLEMEQRFQNYSNAMSLKEQGENIAKAYAQQVKSYGELNQTNSPEALLQNFNNNMQAIADLQTQNKADNLNQLTNTLSSSLNDLNSGNYEGAMFSALSLLDQSEAKREARREVEIYQQQLIYQAQKQMSNFYWKAVHLNNQAIDQYYQDAAYAFSKADEDFLLEYVKHHECFKGSMEANFSYSSTSWTQNKCPTPIKVNSMENNLVAKDIQYIQTAKRKYQLYLKTGRNEFQQGAMKFAGLAANTNPKAEYYYLMGHYAGINNPLIAYSSFLTTQSKSSTYFNGDKESEFMIVKLSLEEYFKEAIEENNKEVIKNIVGASLHHAVSIDGNAPIIYAIKIDQPDVVQAFLNTDLEGKTQTAITQKVRGTIMLAAMSDAPNTVDRFANMGFGVNFNVDGQSPLDAAEESISLMSFKKITELLGGQTKYNFENSDFIKVRDLVNSANINDTINVINIYQKLKNNNSKYKAIDKLLVSEKRDGFFAIVEADNNLVSQWAKFNQTKIFNQFCKEVLYTTNRNVYRYLSTDLIQLNNGVNLNNEQLEFFIENWISTSIHTLLEIPYETRKKSGFLDHPIVYRPYRDLSTEKNLAYLDDNYGLMNKLNKESISKEVVMNYIRNKKPYSLQINLIDFAVYYRSDFKMAKVLLDNYNYQGIKPGVNYEIIGFNINNSGPCYFNLGNDLFYNILNSNQLPHNLETYKFLDQLIFHYGFEENTLSNLLRFLFSSQTFGMSYPANISDEYIKSLVEKLIKHGYVEKGLKMFDDPKQEEQFTKNLIRSIKKRETKKDAKFWKAVIEGSYDERY